MKVRFHGQSDPLTFIDGKEYEVLSIEEGWYRIIDETGEDYLYAPDAFEVTDASKLVDKNTKHNCPVCGQYEFPEENSFDICPVCNWEDDADQEEYPDEENGANQMSLNQAREAWAHGKRVDE